MEEMKRKYLHEKGITLVALVITIIILLILAGVAIASLTGDNGLFARANQARQNTLDAQNKENETLEGFEDAITSTVGVDWEYALANATKHPDQKTSTAIGVGTDGKPVNMDLWEYTLLEDGTYILNDGDVSNGRGYIGSINSDGTIIGKIPQYISVDNGKTYKPVTSLYQCMVGKSELKIAPEIPSTVTDIRDMFYQLKNLEQMSYIPNSVTNMQGTFNGCANLVTIPNFPANLENLSFAFQNCTRLEYVPVIPKKVVNMYGTFYQCSNLVEVSDIPEGVQNMELTFFQCKSLTTVKRIPSTVTTLKQTFQECINLSGEMKIDAQITDISSCYLTFFGATNQNGKTLRLKGSCPVLSEIVTNANNPNITL